MSNTSVPGNESEAAGSGAAANGETSGSPMSREVRLGLVLYGGVSLAIYMNGVAQEFFNAARGRGIYRLIKILTDSDVVIDIISGASAGGVNGIFLASALRNEREFGTFAKLWRRQADVSLLLRDPRKDPDNCHSLFDSEGYYQKRLYEAFAEAFAAPNQIKESVRALEWVSDSDELDVFIAGSDVEGRVFSTVDTLGQTIDVKDHRVIFRLKHRTGHKEPFNPHFEDARKVQLRGQAASNNDNEAEEKVVFSSLATFRRKSPRWESVESSRAGR